LKYNTLDYGYSKTETGLLMITWWPVPNNQYTHRVSCIDRIHFNKDGTIQPVKMTFKGVEKQSIK